MNKEIQFTKDYATFKKGDTWTASRDLTSMLVRLKVAVYYEKPKRGRKKKTE